MNILPKKRWHVRSKDNIARVRRDEALAKEEERKRQDKLLLAESEARINFLRKKSNLPLSNNASDETKISTEKVLNKNQINVKEHVDLFADYKSHIKQTNKALEEEKKEEREKYEKQIGYLTYLGQDTNEALKLRSWYEVAPKRTEVGDAKAEEKDLKKKQSQDPLTLINSLIPTSDSSIITCNSSAHPNQTLFSIPNKKPKKRKSEYEESGHVKNKKAKKQRKHKHKEKLKRKKSSSSEESDSDAKRRIKQLKLEQLRKERLARETSERARQEALLAPILSTKDLIPKAVPTQRIVQKYNSQFNPELAKQNMI